MEAERFIALRVDIEAQVAEIDAIYLRLDSRREVDGEAGTESLAFQIHNLYSAFEELFRVIAATFENHVDAGGGYHIELLKRMKVSVPGVRPAVIDSRAFQSLDSLRSFRHFFRHAYGSPIDSKKLDLVYEDAQRIRPDYRRWIEGFLSKVSPE